MERRGFVAGMGAMLIAPAAHAQKSTVYRIGCLAALRPPAANLEALREGLLENGYRERSNITIDYRWADGRFDRLDELAAELVRLPVHVIIAVVTQASLAAKKATSVIPVVMVGVSDPISAGLASSLARPSGNVTGTSSASSSVAAKSLELLKGVSPKLSSVVALWNPANAVFQEQMLRETATAARSLGVQIHAIAARSPEEIEQAFDSIVKRRAEGLVVLADPLFAAHAKRIAALALKARLPSVSGFSAYAEAGCLLAYGPNFPELYRRAAYFIAKILEGTKPGDLPIEQPTKFELVVNLKTAKSLGLTIPPSLLLRADQVIE